MGCVDHSAHRRSRARSQRPRAGARSGGATAAQRLESPGAPPPVGIGAGGEQSNPARGLTPRQGRARTRTPLPGVPGVSKAVRLLPIALAAACTCGTSPPAPPERDAPTDGSAAFAAHNPFADEWATPGGRPPPVTLVSVDLPTFVMSADDGGTRPVRFRAPFAISATEVTQGAWRAVMGDLPATQREGSPDCELPDLGDDLPVTCVTWFDAVRFVRRLSRWHGFEEVLADNEGVLVFRREVPGLRLPTEAEWEAAARAGSSTMAYPGLGSPGAACGLGNVRDAAHHSTDAFPCDDGYARLAAVGRFPANPFQVHDLVGNVSEWVFDRYGPLTPSLSFDPLGPTMGSQRVIRGQSYLTAADEVRVEGRRGAEPSHRAPDLGFRVAATLAPPMPEEAIDAAIEEAMEAESGGWDDLMFDDAFAPAPPNVWLTPQPVDE